MTDCHDTVLFVEILLLQFALGIQQIHKTYNVTKRSHNLRCPPFLQVSPQGLDTPPVAKTKNATYLVADVISQRNRRPSLIAGTPFGRYASASPAWAICASA